MNKEKQDMKLIEKIIKWDILITSIISMLGIILSFLTLREMKIQNEARDLVSQLDKELITYE